MIINIIIDCANYCNCNVLKEVIKEIYMLQISLVIKKDFRMITESVIVGICLIQYIGR